MARILFVDDDALALRLMGKFAEFTGNEAILSLSPNDGLRIAAEQRPDLILVDLMMAEMDGFAFIQLLRAQSVIAHIPVVMLSALQTWELEKRAGKSGANGYLEKPIGIKELKFAVERYVMS